MSNKHGTNCNWNFHIYFQILCTNLSWIEIHLWNKAQKSKYEILQLQNFSCFNVHKWAPIMAKIVIEIFTFELKSIALPEFLLLSFVSEFRTLLFSKHIRFSQFSLTVFKSVRIKFKFPLVSVSSMFKQNISFETSILGAPVTKKIRTNQ